MPRIEDINDYIYMGKTEENKKIKYKIKSISGSSLNIVDKEVNKFLEENNAEIFDFKVSYNAKNSQFNYVYILKYLEE